MIKLKQMVRSYSLLNDRPHRIFERKTTVYTRKDKTSYINVNYNRQEVIPDTDGMLCYTIKIYSILI